MVDPIGDKFNINDPVTLKIGGDLDNDENVITANPIHISTQQVTARKKLTIIRGIPDDIDLPLVLKAWKKLFHCTGSTKEDNKTHEMYISLSGDHRTEVAEFLIHEGIGTKENIKIHGADM